MPFPDPTLTADATRLADRIDGLLPQTQCTKCGYQGCRPYAEAMATGAAAHNHCPPGGAEGVARLSNALNKPFIALNPENGIERSRALAVIDEAACIGCTLCIQACPVDAIVGATQRMHTVIPELCTGCDLCVAPCPVDCIVMVPVTAERTGWSAWSASQADGARKRHLQREARLVRDKEENDARLAGKATVKLLELESHVAGSATENPERDRKIAVVRAAIARARARKEVARADETSSKSDRD
jgi:electron transport complex protein RnfB